MIYTYETVQTSSTVTTMTCTRENGASTIMTLSTNSEQSNYSQTGDFLLLPLGAYGLPLPTDDSIDCGYYSIILADVNGDEIATYEITDNVTIGIHSGIRSITFRRQEQEVTNDWSLSFDSDVNTLIKINSLSDSPAYYNLAWKAALTATIPGITVTEGT